MFEELVCFNTEVHQFVNLKIDFRKNSFYLV